MRRKFLALVSALALASTASAQAQTAPAPYQPPTHSVYAPIYSQDPAANSMVADGGTDYERGRTAGYLLAEHRRLDAALKTLQPQRKGVVDAYVVSIALDSDPVFGREAREAGRVLARRYDAAGHTIVLGGTDGSAASDLPMGSPQALGATLARVAELMDRQEDVLILYTTSHGAPFGIVYNDGDEGFGAISPYRLWSMLGDLGIKNRLLIISACFSGIFVPLLSNDTTAIMTAAQEDRTSFGCVSDNDWTFFGDAMINHGLRKPQPLASAFQEAKGLIGQWEAQGKLIPSGPQVSIGANVQSWLGPLEARMPRATTAPVGRPAITSLDVATAHNH